MRHFIKLVAIVLFITSHLAWAQHDEHDHAHSHEELEEALPSEGSEGVNCNNIVNVKVNGLVCDFCARALEKMFGRRDEVGAIDVDLDKSSVKVAMKDGKSVDDSTLKKIITDSGYNVVSINRGC